MVQRREDPVMAAFRDAPEDDEAFTAADEGALAEVQAERAANSYGDSFVKGLTPDARAVAGIGAG
jgi:hypothetical protein